MNVKCFHCWMAAYSVLGQHHSLLSDQSLVDFFNVDFTPVQSCIACIWRIKIAKCQISNRFISGPPAEEMLSWSLLNIKTLWQSFTQLSCILFFPQDFKYKMYMILTWFKDCNTLTWIILFQFHFLFVLGHLSWLMVQHWLNGHCVTVSQITSCWKISYWTCWSL